ncbi:hypothetical protein Jiend_27750 [Micromonospora endophytica]|nr:hypothetical protein Jiend_27750 [Micromonospora endophytica]
MDARSDVYAAGCVLFELLCGHPPFVGDSPVSVAYQHVREAPPTPSDINPDVNPAVDAIVLKALSKNPLNRYQSAGEMRADLLRAAAGRPVMATPVMREDETVAMAAAAPGYPSAGATQTRQIPARVGDPRQRRASSWLIAVFAALGVLAVIALIAAVLLNNREAPDVPVPTLTGMTQQEAVARIEQDGFTAAIGAPEFTSDCKKGTVTKQTPTAGDRVAPNSTVTLSICGGKPEVTIPPLVGSTRAAAEERLKELNLKFDIEEKDDAATKGQVLAVDPAEGEKVAEGTEVTLTVSKGNVVRVPNVVGLSEADAKRELSNAGFEVNVEIGPEVPAAQAGRVTDQNPNANSQRTKGTRVTIFVSVEEPEDPDPPTPDPPTSGTPSPTTTPPGDDDDGGGNGGGGPVLPTFPPFRLSGE